MLAHAGIHDFLSPPHPKPRYTPRIPTRFPTMPTTATTATDIIATLRAHQPELRQAGILSLRLFGSHARGDAEPDSDIDLLADLDPAAQISLLDLIALERRLTALLGQMVDILPTPVESSRLRANVERDATDVF